MKQFISVILICLLVSPFYAQTTKELFSDCGLSQVFDYYYDTPSPDPQSLRYLYDTIRNGDEVLEFELVLGNLNSISQFFRIDGQKVYYYNRWYDPADPVVEKEWMFYDFGASLGEKVNVAHVNQPGFLIIGHDYTVIEKSTIQLADGIDRIHMILELDAQPSLTLEWIEGIGNTDGGMLRPAWRNDDVLLDCAANINGTLWMADDFTPQECEDRLALFTLEPAPCESTLSSLEIPEKQIKIFPNPAMDQLIVNKNSEATLRVRIYNMQGKLIIENLINSKLSQIDFSELNFGLYQVQFYNEQGKFIQAEKVMVSRK